jgi:hypothetical protein
VKDHQSTPATLTTTALDGFVHKITPSQERFIREDDALGVMLRIELILYCMVGAASLLAKSLPLTRG